MKTKRFIATVLAGLLALPSGIAHAIEVSEGTVRGLNMADGSVIYYGLPYAAAPEGERRWKPPVTSDRWEGVRDATQMGPACVQQDFGWNQSFTASASEDCLTLSVRTPDPSGTKKLPVFVYIHGGMNAAAGSGSLENDAIHREGVVLVKIQYRLGIFGFMGLDALAAESPHDSSGNYALLDQIAALHWIRANISAFGGDPNNVTISGNSAGALNVIWLTLSPLADGLYHKAIIQAGAPGAPRSASENESIGAALLNRLGLPNSPEGLKRLRELPARHIIEAAKDLPVPDGIDPSYLWEQQILDGYVLSHPYAAAYRNGATRNLPVIIGSNRQEMGGDRKPEQTPQLLASAFGKQANEAEKLYRSANVATPEADSPFGNMGMQIITDAWFRCPVTFLSEQMLGNDARVWRYEFGFGPPDSNKPPEHTSEMNYIYHAVPADTKAGDWPPVQRYWVNFMHTGNPNGEGLVHWPAADANGTYLEIEPSGLTAKQALRTDICKLMYKDHDYPLSAYMPVP